MVLAPRLRIDSDENIPPCLCHLHCDSAVITDFPFVKTELKVAGVDKDGCGDEEENGNESHGNGPALTH